MSDLKLDELHLCIDTAEIELVQAEEVLKKTPNKVAELEGFCQKLPEAVKIIKELNEYLHQYKLKNDSEYGILAEGETPF